MAPHLVYLYSRCPCFLSFALILDYNIPYSLATLSTKTIYKVIKVLSFNNARNFLLCSSLIYKPRKYAFNKKCFRVLLIRLSREGLLKAKELIIIKPLYFI
jgi:hypothetical protein